jgi:hypothetical protein
MTTKRMAHRRVHQASLPSATMPTASYSRNPILASQVRILLLEPSLDASAPLRFAFETIWIVEFENTYEDVSYTWGEPIFPHAVVDKYSGMTIAITHNLNALLHHFRYELHVRKLWIDAICLGNRKVG